ncbi:MAG: type II toxin-antitoxin system HicA family toxin [Rhodomicrobium sp.]
MTKSTKAGPKPSIVYERNSRKLKSRLEKDGWYVDRVNGDHHIMKHPTRKGRIVLCHPVKDLPEGTVKRIYKDAGWHA